MTTIPRSTGRFEPPDHLTGPSLLRHVPVPEIVRFRLIARTRGIEAAICHGANEVPEWQIYEPPASAILLHALEIAANLYRTTADKLALRRFNDYARYMSDRAVLHLLDLIHAAPPPEQVFMDPMGDKGGAER